MGPNQLAMVALYREGAEGHGKPAHIIMRRFIGGYNPENLHCDNKRKHPADKNMDVCVKGSTDLNEENEQIDGEEGDARAHRGFLRGDMLVLGYTYDPKVSSTEHCVIAFLVRLPIR